MVTGLTFDAGCFEILGMRGFQRWRLDRMMTVFAVHPQILAVHLVRKDDFSDRRREAHGLRRLDLASGRLVGFLGGGRKTSGQKAEDQNRLKPEPQKSCDENFHSETPFMMNI